MPINKIAKLSLYDIHCKIREEKIFNIDDAVFALGVSIDALNKRLKLNNTSFIILKTMDIDSAEKLFAPNYRAPLGKIRVDLSQWLFKELHEKIYNKNKRQATVTIGISARRLDRLLSDLGFNYEALQYFNPELAKTEWSDLYNLTLDVIIKSKQFRHSCRITPEEITKADLFLEIPSEKFNLELASVTLTDFLAQFDKNYKKTPTNLSKRSIRDIHPCILKAENALDAARLLRVERQVLKRYLAPRGLSFDQLHNKPIEEAEKELGDLYKSLIAIPKPNLPKERLRYIHEKICYAPHIAAAAAFFGVSSETLKDYLKKLGTDFDSFKDMKIEDAETKFGKRYDNPLKRSEMDHLSMLSLCQIHQQIINKSYIGKKSKLIEHLMDRGTSYDVLLGMSTDEAKEKFDSIYDEISVWKEEVDISKLTLTNILKEISKVDCLFSLAKCLEINPEKLKSGLMRLGYNFVTLKKQSQIDLIKEEKLPNNPYLNDSKLTLGIREEDLCNNPYLNDNELTLGIRGEDLCNNPYLNDNELTLGIREEDLFNNPYLNDNELTLGIREDDLFNNTHLNDNELTLDVKKGKDKNIIKYEDRIEDKPYDSENIYSNLIHKFRIVLRSRRQKQIKEMWSEQPVKDAVANLDDRELSSVLIDVVMSADKGFSRFVQEFVRNIQRNEPLKQCLVHIKDSKLRFSDSEARKKRVAILQQQIDKLSPSNEQNNMKRKHDTESHLQSTNKKRSSSLAFNPYTFYNAPLDSKAEKKDDLDVFLSPQL